jgi:hydrogenase expression/formation protein HypE
VRPAVRSACALLGLDPLFVANEGKLLAVVAPDAAGLALEVLRRHPLGADAAMVGEVTGEGKGRVSLEKRTGGIQVVEMLSGGQLPRIC